jgi:glycosyltransferase involved in cell wall biosynthesis
VDYPLRIGIVTPAHDAAPWIADCLRSVLRQTHPNWSMVVVDDGSADATAEVVAGFSDPRIRLIRQPQAGVSVARNRGLAALPDSDGVLFLDADDWLASDALARLGAALQRAPGAVAAVGACAFVPEAAPRGARPRRVKQPHSGDVLLRLLDRNLFANGGHVLVARAAAEAVGGFHPDLSFGEDWEYWVRLALRGVFVPVRGRRPLLFVRERPAGAYLRMATDPAAFAACTVAIFDNPGLVSLLGGARVAGLWRHARAETIWVTGRAMLRFGRITEGRSLLRQSFGAKPGLRRAVLTATAHLPVLHPISRTTA